MKLAALMPIQEAIETVDLLTVNLQSTTRILNEMGRMQVPASLAADVKALIRQTTAMQKKHTTNLARAQKALDKHIATYTGARLSKARASLVKMVESKAPKRGTQWSIKPLDVVFHKAPGGGNAPFAMTGIEILPVIPGGKIEPITIYVSYRGEGDEIWGGYYTKGHKKEMFRRTGGKWPLTELVVGAFDYIRGEAAKVEEANEKVISGLPPKLKTLVANVKKKLVSLMRDPSELVFDVKEDFTKEHKSNSYRSWTITTRFTVVTFGLRSVRGNLRAEGLPNSGLVRVYALNSDKGEDYIEMGVPFISTQGYGEQHGFGSKKTAKKVNSDMVVAAFQEAVKKEEGQWTGWLSTKAVDPGERDRVAKEIGEILYDVARSEWGSGSLYGRKPEIENWQQGMVVSMQFRTNTDSRDYGQYDDSYEDEAKGFGKPFKRALSGYERYIKSQGVGGDGEKGWWSYDVTLL